MKPGLLYLPLAALVLACALACGANTPAPRSEPKWGKIPGAEHHARIREARLRFQLTLLPAEEVERALQHLTANEVSSQSAVDFLVMAEILAEKAGGPALAFTLKHRARDVGDRAIRTAFVHGWAKADINAAAAWLDANPGTGWDEDERVELARTLLQTHARRDPSGAMERALRYGNAEPSRRETLVLAVIEELVYHGQFETARELTEKLTVPEMRRPVQADLIGIVAEHQPELATTWFRELPLDQERAGMIFRLVDAWAARGLREATAFFETLEPHERTIDLVESMLVSCSDPQPEIVEKLAAGFPAGPELDRLLIGALTRINTVSPSEIPWRWFERFTQPRARDSLLASLLAQHYRHDSAAAKAIIESLPFLGSEQREQLLHAVTRSTIPAPAR
jgi:hypothetical protein